MPVFQPLRQNQEAIQFQASLDYIHITRSCFRKAVEELGR
jgi:hypothetical protein